MSDKIYDPTFTEPADRLDAYAEAGVDEFAFLPVGVGSDPQASVLRTWEVLAELATERNAGAA